MRGLALAAVVGLLVVAGLNVWHRVAAASQASAEASRARVKELLNAETARVPALILGIEGDRRWSDAELKRVLGDPLVTAKARLHASLALLPVDPTQFDYLRERLREASPEETLVLMDSLSRYRDALTPDLWQQLGSAQAGNPRILPAASMLAGYDPGNSRWPEHVDKVAQALVTTRTDLIGSWLELLRPVGDRLAEPLAAIFRDHDRRTESERELATSGLVEYARDDPARLADLVMDADPKAYRRLFAVAAKQADKVSPIFQEELRKQPQRKDTPLDPSWTKPDPAFTQAIESAQGFLHDRFAFFQSMPLAEFLRAKDDLQKLGYRPLRYRPYADGRSVKVASVWTRDKRNWRIAPIIPPTRSGALMKRTARRSSSPSMSRDTSRPATRPNPSSDMRPSGSRRLKAKMPVSTSARWSMKHPSFGIDSRRWSSTLGRSRCCTPPDGRLRMCSVWGRSTAAGGISEAESEVLEGGLAAIRSRRADEVLLDVAVSDGGGPRALRARILAARYVAERILGSKPGDVEAMKSRAIANLRLGESEKAYVDLNVLIGTGKEDAEALLYRAIARARLGRKKEALEDLARFQRSFATDQSKVPALAVLCAELGEGIEDPLRALDAMIEKRPEDDEITYAIARAFAFASRPIAERDSTKGRRIAARAIRLLEEAVRRGDADYGRIDNDPALDPIRDEPAFVALMKAGHPERRYAAVWSDESSVQDQVIEGRDPTEHRERARKLMTDGYYPVALSVARIGPEGRLLSTSVWHRKVISEQEKDRLARRQARAAVGSLRLGKAELVWPLLRHSPNPRLRSFVVNWLKPLDADPKVIVAEFGRVNDSAGRGIARIPEKPEEFLFDTETSIRRALILAMGTYGPDELQASEEQRLVAALLELYRSDPDAGIHGAAEWTLRRWKHEKELRAIDADLKKLEDRGEHRWFVNKQGQTLTVIDVPVAFRMGSPGSEPERTLGNEVPRTMIIPARSPSQPRK